jgi:peptidoglycan/xylan/chitin deacetylase (PgdA/CDA1 family)
VIVISIPNNNQAERSYIIDVMFDDFLGIEYRIEKKEISNYEILLENGKKIIIVDAFFNQYENNLDYLNINNIPKKTTFTDSDFSFAENIPIIYGDQCIDIKNDTLYCFIDIFSSSFFMLTRWEEYVNTVRDSHNRFPAEESLAFKCGFLDRAIVNDYIDLLKKLLVKMECNENFAPRKYNAIITHDVDHISAWDTKKKFLLRLLKDLLRKRSIDGFFKSIKYYVKMKKSIENDPYDTFDYLMDLSEKYKVKSYFFFMAEGLSKTYDNQYKSDSAEVKNIVRNIKKRGHFIGFHPSYYAYNLPEQFEKEKLEIEKNLSVNIKFGREHYLRFDVPKTWQIWEDNNMEWGSTMNYSGEDGFRCGVCYPFRVFNILTQKKLLLKEKPLIVMDANGVNKKGMNPKIMKKNIEKINAVVKKHNGEFVFLWHNSSFNTDKWSMYHDTYESIMESSTKEQL